MEEFYPEIVAGLFVIVGTIIGAGISYITSSHIQKNDQENAIQRSNRERIVSLCTELVSILSCFMNHTSFDHFPNMNRASIADTLAACEKLNAFFLLRRGELETFLPGEIMAPLRALTYNTGVYSEYFNSQADNNLNLNAVDKFNADSMHIIKKIRENLGIKG
ncbi:hypothetical protein [Oscillibacter sp.]|uniref:hypothetical protein n=1 Tax=Oscillibacter sp. TaxID=1945593 RepID=UPI00339AE969